MVLFKTENLTFAYPHATEHALSNVNLEINKGDFIVLMGRTGSGKSTLLRLLNPVLAPFGETEGSIEIKTKKTGYVGQNPDITFVSENVRSELVFALENQRMSNNDIALRLGEISSFFNLSHLLDRNISALSGGEKATVAIAAAMVNNADAVILDEPTAQLDSKSAYELINLLKRVNDELGVTVVITSHLSDGLIDKCDRLIVLDKGSIIFDDKPENASDDVLPFYPLSAQLFDERPLTVRDAVAFACRLSEKPLKSSSISSEIVNLKKITFAYEKKGRDILEMLDFKAYEGKIHCIIGANGSGKTTLLKIIAGIKKPYSGKVRVNGRASYLPQNPQFLFTKDTVGEEIDEQTADRFGLGDKLGMHPYDLSGGQAQKLAMAILSKQQYDILLLDEPSKALDVFYKKELIDYLKALEKTIIIVSHDLDFVGDIADYVSFLSDGVITIAGERRQVLSSLSYYTTQVRRITAAHLTSAVSTEDLL